jgi:hypothetical protein
MIGQLPIGVAIVLVLAIAVLSLVALRFMGKPKQRPEKWEKAEIMKQLLALSECEMGLAVKTTPARLHAPAPRQAKRTSNSHSSGLQRPLYRFVRKQRDVQQRPFGIDKKPCVQHSFARRGSHVPLLLAC